MVNPPVRTRSVRSHDCKQIMSMDRLRRRVAFEAAKLIYAHEETQYGRAKMKAARRLVSGQVKPDDLPCNREIRRCIQTIARTSRAEQEQLLTQVSADRALGRPTEADENTLDRFRTYELLLAPLEDVMQSPENHPEGDVLYHSLQVFELARQKLPYDEEFLLAALLHDVGKAIDRRDHVAAGLEALSDAVSPRTAWLIEHHVEALSLRDGTLGVRTAPPARSGRGFRRVDALGRLRPAWPGRGPGDARRAGCARLRPRFGRGVRGFVTPRTYRLGPAPTDLHISGELATLKGNLLERGPAQW